ncbi:hypothetical protein PALU110988_17080 [Paenibacillus lupini]|nr:hypothetical protein [Paenibacillus lupini]
MALFYYGFKRLQPEGEFTVYIGGNSKEVQGALFELME